MQNLIVLLNKNTVKATTVGKEGLGYLSRPVSEEAAYEFRIKNVDKFAEELSGVINDITKTSRNNLSLTFLINPKDVYQHFVTLAKGDGSVEERIISEIQKKLEDVSLDDLYFSYEKIAPFVYQFTGIRKEFLETYMEVANKLGVTLSAVIPWVMLLPKYTKMCDPSIYIVNYDGDQVVALSELNGIFFTEIFEDEQDPKEFEEVIQKLTVYKRPNPISKIYTVNYPSLMLDDSYQVEEIDIPNKEVIEEKGFEVNMLANYMVDTSSENVIRQLNLLNLLPVPATVDRKSGALVYVGVAAGIVLLISGIVFAGSRLNKNNNKQLASADSSSNQVLSESNTNESTQSEKPQEEPVEELKRSDLTARVENGAGIPGIAGRTQSILENLGYNVSDIGNADQIGNSETILRFKKDTAKYADMMKDDMKDTYLDIKVEDTLDESAEYGVLVIVGTDIKE